MPLRVEQHGNTQAVGGMLDAEELKALSAYAPKVDDILAGIDQLNESFATEGVKEGIGQWDNTEDQEAPKKLPVQKKPAVNHSPNRRGTMPSKALVPRAKRKQLEAMQNEPVVETTRTQTQNIGPSKMDDLDTVLDSMNARMDYSPSQTPESAQAAPEAPNLHDQIMGILNNIEGAPTERQIAQWKVKHGENGVHVIAFSDSEAYIFTHLKRGQWKKVQDTIAKMRAQGGEAGVSEDEIQEKIIQHCVLWPRLELEFFYNSRAGIVPSLYDAIMANSYFLSPQQTMMLTTSF